MTNTFIKGDCIGVADQIADNSVDLLLTDPPYNISNDGAFPLWLDKETGKSKNTIHNQNFSASFDEKWDAVSHDEFVLQLASWSEMWFKKLRKGGSFAVFISDKYISHLWQAMEEAGFEPKRIWNWKKPAAVPFNRSFMPVSGCEYLLFGIKPNGKRTFNSDCERNNIVDRYSIADKLSSILYKHVKDCGEFDLDKAFADAKAEALAMMATRKHTGTISHAVIPNTITFSGGIGKDKLHPTQKPTEILEYFIELLSNPGDMVLDTFGGSGSTGVAAEKLGRNSILIERDEKMFNTMVNRFKDQSSYNDLFS